MKGGEKKLISKGDDDTLIIAIEVSKSFEASNKNLNEYYNSIGSITTVSAVTSEQLKL